MIEEKEKSSVKRDKIVTTEKEQADYWLNLEILISTISSRFLGNTLIDDALNASLRDVGILTGVSRSYIFQFSDDKKLMNNTHEWCAEDISPRVHKLHDLESKRFPWWIQQLKEGRNIQSSDVKSLHKTAQPTKEL